MAKKSLARKAATKSTGLVGPSKSSKLMSEVEGFPARHLAELPLAMSLWLEIPGAPVPVCLTTAARAPEQDGVLGPVIVFHREEIAALVCATESERLWRKELLGLCFEKWRRPALRISAGDALGGANAGADGEPWSLARVLARLGATLARVELADDAVAPVHMPVAA